MTDKQERKPQAAAAGQLSTQSEDSAPLRRLAASLLAAVTVPSISQDPELGVRSLLARSSNPDEKSEQRHESTVSDGILDGIRG